MADHVTQVVIADTVENVALTTTFWECLCQLVKNKEQTMRTLGSKEWTSRYLIWNIFVDIIEHSNNLSIPVMMVFETDRSIAAGLCLAAVFRRTNFLRRIERKHRAGLRVPIFDWGMKNGRPFIMMSDRDRRFGRSGCSIKELFVVHVYDEMPRGGVVVEAINEIRPCMTP